MIIVLFCWVKQTLIKLILPGFFSPLCYEKAKINTRLTGRYLHGTASAAVRSPGHPSLPWPVAQAMKGADNMSVQSRGISPGTQSPAPSSLLPHEALMASNARGRRVVTPCADCASGRQGARSPGGSRCRRGPAVGTRNSCRPLMLSSGDLSERPGEVVKRHRSLQSDARGTRLPGSPQPAPCTGAAVLGPEGRTLLSAACAAAAGRARFSFPLKDIRFPIFLHFTHHAEDMCFCLTPF